MVNGDQLLVVNGDDYWRLLMTEGRPTTGDRLTTDGDQLLTTDDDQLLTIDWQPLPTTDSNRLVTDDCSQLVSNYWFHQTTGATNNRLATGC